jgi:hypothetical protein
LVTDILSKLNFNDVFNHEKVKNISSPTNVAHRLSITINPVTGKFEVCISCYNSSIWTLKVNNVVIIDTDFSKGGSSINFKVYY